MDVGFSLGSNRGNRLARLREAKRRILDTPDVALVAQSPLYETEPVGVAPEHAHLQFFNAVLIVESERGPAEWLDLLREIEYAMGRRRGDDRNAPRPIDVDIIYAGTECIDRGGLVVPHPRWAQRRFVVQPLADVRPDLVLPGAGKPVRAILGELTGEHVTEILRDW